MKRTPQELKEEKQRVSNYMHTIADLSVENTGIVWKTGTFIAVLFAALFVASYYVSDHTIVWLIYLMPIGAYFISRKYRVRKSDADIQFQQIWLDMWVIAAAMTIPTLLLEELSVYSIFVVYYIALTIGIFILQDLMRTRYSAMIVVGSFGIALSGFRLGLDPDVSIRLYLVNFFIFDILLFVMSGAAMRWQVKNRIKNPVNFPEHTK